jgi:hypothetical protein
MRSGPSGPVRSPWGLRAYGSLIVFISDGSRCASSNMFSMLAIVPPLAPPLKPFTRNCTREHAMPWRARISRCMKNAPRSAGTQSKPQQKTMRAPLAAAAG